MSERDVLTRRRATLEALLAMPRGPLGPNAGALGQRLQAAWWEEVRLIERLLAEARGDGICATIGDWRARTRAFATRLGSEAARWTDREGHSWQAAAVLELLDALEARIESERTAGHHDGAIDKETPP